MLQPEVVESGATARTDDSISQKVWNEVRENPGAVALSLASVGVAAAVKFNPRSVVVPILKSGEAAGDVAYVKMAANAPLSRLYAQSKDSVGKVETIRGFAGDKKASSGTAFSISNDGRLVTANHVVRDAKDFSIVDGKGVVHDARVLASDDIADIALLQLTNPASFKAFKPLKVAAPLKEPLNGGELFALGHPDGVNSLVLSHGDSAGKTFESTRSIFSNVVLRPGNSGGPLLNKSGEVVGVNVQMIGLVGKQGSATSTKISRAQELMTEARVSAEPVSAVKAPTREWTIADGLSARKELEMQLGRTLGEKPANTSFYSAFANAQFKDGSVLSLRTSLDPSARVLRIKPIGFNGEPLTDEMIWGASKSRLVDTELLVKLDKKMNPVRMISVHDPHDTLKRTLHSRGGYLANLQAASA